MNLSILFDFQVDFRVVLKKASVDTDRPTAQKDTGWVFGSSQSKFFFGFERIVKLTAQI